MATRTLRLQFEPSSTPESDPSVRTVHCFQRATDSRPEGESLKEFCGGDYAELGREVGIDWFRRFSMPGREGKTLHDLFLWEGTSALWFTRHLFLYEDLGIFPKLLAILRTLRLVDAGEVDRVELTAPPDGFAQVLRDAGISVAHAPSGGPRNRTKGAIALFRDAARGAARRFLQSRRLRSRFAEQHRPGQTDCLLYMAVQGEWLPGPDGGHRYLEDALHELVELGEVGRVRPVVFGIPPAFRDDSEWCEFLGRSLKEKGGIYPMAFVTPADALRIRRWVKRSMHRLSAWLAETPAGFDRIGGRSLGPIVRGELAGLAGQLERGLIQYVAFQKTFARIRPRGFLLKDEVYPHGRIAVAAAHSVGVKNVALQHGSIYPTHWCYLMDPEAAGISRPPLPDLFGVYGAAVERLLSDASGFPPKSLCVLGARRFRELDRLTPSQEFLELKKTGRPLILVAGQLHQDMPRVYDWILAAAERHPNFTFIFKPHPRDRAGVESLEKRCGGLKNSRVFAGAIGGLLPAADLVVSCHSTVLLEAVWLGVGGISVLVSGETAEDWRENAGLIKIARTREDLEGFLSALRSGNLFTGEDRRRAAEYLETHLGCSVARDSKALQGLFS